MTVAATTTCLGRCRHGLVRRGNGNGGVIVGGGRCRRGVHGHDESNSDGLNEYETKRRERERRKEQRIATTNLMLVGETRKRMITSYGLLVACVYAIIKVDNRRRGGISHSSRFHQLSTRC